MSDYYSEDNEQSSLNSGEGKQSVRPRNPSVTDVNGPNLRRNEPKKSDLCKKPSIIYAHQQAGDGDQEGVGKRDKTRTNNAISIDRLVSKKSRSLRFFR